MYLLFPGFGFHIAEAQSSKAYFLELKKKIKWLGKNLKGSDIQSVIIVFSRMHTSKKKGKRFC